MALSKRAAKEKAQSETLSIGELRTMIAQARGRGGMSRVNPMLPHERALDIYERALATRDAAEIPKAWTRDVYSPHDNAMKPTRDTLIIANILRDCA